MERKYMLKQRIMPIIVSFLLLSTLAMSVLFYPQKDKNIDQVNAFTDSLPMVSQTETVNGADRFISFDIVFDGE